MKVLTFSRVFPSYHPKKGDHTFFPEKILISLGLNKDSIRHKKLDWLNDFALGLEDPKHHTIRAGNRWKVGDFFSPRVWSDKPYRSKQIEFAPPIEVKKVFDFHMDLNGVYDINGKYVDNEDYQRLALNDGLTEDDMFNWFMHNYKKPNEFTGQIICWNENLNY